ncbi:MAG TPA: hypothetical protein DCF33_10375 [Saprospirales bacterium]|nr:hypothetical protein [Saprospirales bacterium]
MHIDYVTWANLYNNMEIEYSPHIWFKLYGFWNRLQTFDIHPEDLSDDLLELYGSISVSNIPAFVSLTDAFSKFDEEIALTLLSSINPENDLEYY